MVVVRIGGELKPFDLAGISAVNHYQTAGEAQVIKRIEGKAMWIEDGAFTINDILRNGVVHVDEKAPISCCLGQRVKICRLIRFQLILELYGVSGRMLSNRLVFQLCHKIGFDDRIGGAYSTKNFYRRSCHDRLTNG